MEWQTRLRLIAGTFLVTSLLWAGAELYWWSGSVPQAALPSMTLAPGASLNPPVAAGLTAAVKASAPVPQAAAVANAPGQSLIIPVQGIAASQLTDTFTQAREGGLRVHDAIDIMAPRGTPVIAASAGTIEKLFASNAGGLTIYLRCADRRFIHYYAHLDSYAAGLSEGQRVAQGQVLGAVGFTGNANPAGPHLHFAVQLTTDAAKWYEPSTALNPYPLLARR